MRIKRIFTFDSAHSLPSYEGKCHRIHGHTYTLEVMIEGKLIEFGPNRGMVMDFKDLDAIVKKNVLDIYDHYLINDLIENPTGELMILDIANRIKKALTQSTIYVDLKEVVLWESPKNEIIWRDTDEQ